MATTLCRRGADCLVSEVRKSTLRQTSELPHTWNEHPVLNGHTSQGYSDKSPPDSGCIRRSGPRHIELHEQQQGTTTQGKRTEEQRNRTRALNNASHHSDCAELPSQWDSSNSQPCSDGTLETSTQPTSRIASKTFAKVRSADMINDRQTIHSPSAGGVFASTDAQQGSPLWHM